MKKIILFFISIFFITIFIVFSTHKHKNAVIPKEKIVEVKEQDHNEHLYFNGVLTPINISPVITAIDGTVKEKFFEYGSEVKKGEVLFKIQSSALEKDFHSSLADYSKARHEYEERKRKFIGTKKLWELEFIPANEFYSDRNGLEEAHTNLVQSQYRLQQVLAILGNKIDFKSIATKTPSEIDQMLGEQKDELYVFSPTWGLVLTPDKQLGNSETIDSLKPGNGIKAGQTLLNIGDMSGLRIFLKVNEINVNQIKVGQTVTVTGSAFPGILLKGTVTAVNVQADPQSTALPSFPITIEIPNLTAEQQKIIHVGMSAKVRITLPHPKEILIPIAAVYHDNDKTWVKKIDLKTGHTKPMAVITGKTTFTQVVIKKGLQPGDRIVYTD